jgi:hypothetical protein
MRRLEITAIPPTEPQEAKQRLRAWVDANQQILGDLSEQDVVLDVIRASDGRTLHRYRVFLPVPEP